MGKGTRKRVYLAGSYSCEAHCRPLGVDLEYMRLGIEASVQVLKMGHAPFCPWLDFMFQFVAGGAQLTREDYYRYSMMWLEVSDVVYVVNVRENSVGTKAEIVRAKELNIPVVYCLEAI